MMRVLSQEDGSSNIIEYMCVLPLCLIAICFVLVVGYYLHQSAVLDAAVYRSAMVVQQIYNDPNALELIDFSETSASLPGNRMKVSFTDDQLQLERDPYRYFNQNYRASEIQNTVLEKMEHIIQESTISKVDAIYTEEPVPACSGITGFLRKEAKISVTQPFRLPGIFRLVGLPTQVQLHSEVDAPVISQSEFVRNAMFAEDIIEELSEKSQTVGTITETIHTAFAKIGDFFKSDS